MKTKITKHFLVCLWAILGSLQAQDQMTLEQATRYALDNSLTIQNAKINIADADQLIKERKAFGLPQINGKIDYQYYFQVPKILLPESFGLDPEGNRVEATFSLKNNLNLGVSASSILFDGSYLTGVKAAKLYRQYVEKELVAQQQEINDMVRDAYLPPLLISETIAMLDKNITNLEKLHHETEAMYKEGFVEQLDVDRLLLSLANLKTEKENLARQRETAINYLKFAINYPTDKELIIADNMESLLKEATDEELVKPVQYESRPNYQVAQMGIELNAMNVELYKKGYLPSLVAFASYQYGFQGDKFNDEGFWFPTGIVGATVNIPIFDGFDKRAKMQRARLAMDIAQNQKRELERAINLELQNARTNYLSAQEHVWNQKENVDLAERIYDMTQIKYKEGVGSSLEITQAEQSLFNTQQNYTQAVYNLLAAKAALDKALGN